MRRYLVICAICVGCTGTADHDPCRGKINIDNMQHPLLSEAGAVDTLHICVSTAAPTSLPVEAVPGVLLIAGGRAAEVLSFPNLRSAGMIVTESAFQSIAFPALESVGQLIQADDAVLSLPALRDASTLRFYSTQVILTSLETVAELSLIAEAPTTVSLPALPSAGVIRLQGNGFPNIEAPSLSTLGVLSVTLTTGSVDLLGFSALRNVAELVIAENENLSTCAIQQLVSQLAKTPGSMTVENNLDDPLCP